MDGFAVGEPPPAGGTGEHDLCGLDNVDPFGEGMSAPKWRDHFDFRRCLVLTCEYDMDIMGI